MSSLKEVINLQKRQHSRYIDLKKQILNKLTEKITHLAKHGEMRCIYNVPSYVFGAPKYNVADVTTYLYYSFKKEGFCAVILSNDKLFVSWDINDINEIKKKDKSKKQFLDIKPLININK
jgi:hypothetical protein